VVYNENWIWTKVFEYKGLLRILMRLNTSGLLLDSVMTANRFSIFEHLPLTSICFLQSAITCGITFHIYDIISQVIAEKLVQTRSYLTEANPYSSWSVSHSRIDPQLQFLSPAPICQFLSSIVATCSTVAGKKNSFCLRSWSNAFFVHSFQLSWIPVRRWISRNRQARTPNAPLKTASQAISRD
jgi:hypothetical protein